MVLNVVRTYMYWSTLQEFWSLVQQTLAKRSKEMAECKDKIKKAVLYLEKVKKYNYGTDIELQYYKGKNRYV